MSLTEMLQTEAWRKKLEGTGYRVINEPHTLEPGTEPSSQKKMIECQKCGAMYPSTSLCPCCG